MEIKILEPMARIPFRRFMIFLLKFAQIVQQARIAWKYSTGKNPCQFHRAKRPGHYPYMMDLKWGKPQWVDDFTSEVVS